MAFDAGSIEATLDLRRNPFTQGLKQAEQQARDFEKKQYRATIDVDADFRQAQLGLAGFRRVAERDRLRLDVEVDATQIGSAVASATGRSEQVMASSGNRMAKLLLNPVVLQFGLLPGVAAVAAAGSALALGAVVGGFAGIAIAAQKSNKEVKANYANLWSTIKEDAQEMTAPLVPYFVGIAGNIEKAWVSIRPQMDAAFAGLGPRMADLTEVVLEFAQRTMPGVAIAINNSQKALEGLEVMAGRVGNGLSQFFIELSYNQEAAGRGAAEFGTLIETALTSLGVIFGQLTQAWAAVGPQFNATFSQFMNTLTGLTGGALDGFVAVMGSALDVMTLVLNVVEPIAAGLGGMGGVLIGLIASWKILSGTVGLAVKAFSMLAPAAIAGRLAGLTGALDRAAPRFGNAVMWMNMSGEAGNKAESGFRKVTGAVTRAAGALPILGAAVIIATEAINNAFPPAEELAVELLKGGKAAEEAAKKTDGLVSTWESGNPLAVLFGTTMAEARAEAEKLYMAMSPLERAQTDVTRATNNHAQAVNQFGENSPQAAQAAEILAVETNKLEQRQRGAAAATKDHTDRIIEQQNLMLGAVGARLQYQQSLLTLEQSQKSLNEAVKEHGPASLEARNADIAYQQNLVSVVEAVGRRAQAEAEARGETDAAKFATVAMGGEILRLAAAAGENAPAALREMVAGLDAGVIAANGARVAVDAAGNSIIIMPDGKTLKFPNDAPAAQLAVGNLTTAINNVPESKTTKFFREYFDIIHGSSGGGRNDPNDGLPLPRYADGGLFRGRGGPREDANLTWISDREFIVNAKSTDANLALLNFINKGGKLPHYADGGRPSNYMPSTNAFSSVYQYLGQSAGGVLAPAGSYELSKPPIPSGYATGDPALFGSTNQYFKELTGILKQFAEALGAQISGSMNGAELRFDSRGLAKIVTKENRISEQR